MSPLLLITDNPLDIAIVYQLVDQPTNGAIVMMSGMVRGQTEGRGVAYLDYQAYTPMAMAIFAQIAQIAQERFAPIGQVAIHHRLGQLSIGTITVLVAVGAPHRDRAFAACSYAIDAVKQEAPIWKKEYWQDGESTWVKAPSQPDKRP